LKHEIQDLIDGGVIDSQDSIDKARSNEGVCLRDLAHENTFARG